MPKEYKPESQSLANVNLRGLLLYILPAPLFIKVIILLISFKLWHLALSCGALFCFYSGAYITRKSLAALAANRLRPKPNKKQDQRIIAMIYTGAGVLLVMLMIRSGINLRTIFMPLFAMLGYYLVYGISEPKHEIPANFERMPKATREAIQGAYDDLEHIENLAKQLNENDKTISTNLDGVIAQSYKILELISQSPEDAGRARRFLNIYINRIKEILTQYIGLAKYDKADSYRERLSAVLEETHTTFNVLESKLLDNDELKLDVQLDVLDEQMKNENK